MTLKDAEDIGTFIGYTMAYLLEAYLSGLMFQFSYFTFTGKDVWWIYDSIIAGILVYFIKVGDVKIGSHVHCFVFLLCFIARYLLGYQAPWIQ